MLADRPRWPRRRIGFARTRDSVVSEFVAPPGSISPLEVIEQLADPTRRIHVTMSDFSFY